MMTQLENALLAALDRVRRDGDGWVLLSDEAQQVVEHAISLAREQCSHGMRRDLCPDCAPPRESCGSCGADIGESTTYPWHLEDEDCRSVREPVQAPRHHSHNASCYMLGQRQVSYRTCAKLEGEPE